MPSTTSATSILTPVGKAELQRVLGKYQAMSSLEVSFKQTKTLKDIQLKLESEGVLKVQLPNTVEWKIQKPQPLEMLLDKDVIKLKSDGKESIFHASEGSAKDQRAFHDLLNWLRLDASAILENYNVVQEGKNRYRFHAKNSASGMKSLVMNLNRIGHVETLSFEELAGDEIAIRFGTPAVKYTVP